MKSAPKLALSNLERRALREARLFLRRVADVPPEVLADQTGIPLPRCKELVALAQFQSLGSVGPASASDLWRLGYRSVDDLRSENPADMHRRFEEIVGGPVDPCVEDVFRCAVAQATDPGLPPRLRQWWAWSDSRGEVSLQLDDASGSSGFLQRAADGIGCRLARDE